MAYHCDKCRKETMFFIPTVYLNTAKNALTVCMISLFTKTAIILSVMNAVRSAMYCTETAMWDSVRTVSSVKPSHAQKRHITALRIRQSIIT